MKLPAQNKPFSLYFLFFFLTFSLFGLSTSTFAQSASGLSAIPPRLDDITIKPGEVITKTIKVRNESSTTKVITTSVKDMIVSDSQGTPIMLDDKTDTNNRWAASSWIQVSPSKLTLKPGETKALTVIIMAPDNASAGGHYAAILHNPQSDSTLSGSGASVDTYVGTLVYLVVPGDIKEDVHVANFEAPNFSENGPIHFKTIIANLSDIHIAPNGKIVITNMLGGHTANVAFNSENIFPGTTREFESMLNRKWLFGRYQAQLQTAYGSTGQALVATLYFWVIPWRLVLLLTAVIVLAILIVIFSRQHRAGMSDIPVAPKSVTDADLDNLKKKYKDRK